MGRATFSYWKPRFTVGGYAALDAFASRAPQRTRRLDSTIKQQVLTLRRAHPDWGKDRIADELAKAHGWAPRETSWKMNAVVKREMNPVPPQRC